MTKNQKNKKFATVADIILAMESIAPVSLSEKWDNVGLQAGCVDWPVKKIHAALDPLPEVVQDACRDDADLLITHHPLILNPIKSVDFNTPAGSIISMAAVHRLAIFSAHTNLDNTTGGLNDALADRIGLKNIRTLGKPKQKQYCKLVLYVPVEFEQKILDSLFHICSETDAGKTGDYRCCSFRSKGTGTFMPGPEAMPYSGKTEKINHADEIRIEIVVEKSKLNTVISHVRHSHPYETMAYDVYPLVKPEINEVVLPGSGRVGDLEEEIDLLSFAGEIKQRLNLEHIRVTGNPDIIITRTAVCGGSGSGMLNDFFSSGAQVFITGDVKYHDARDVEAANLAIIDIGHFASEHPVVDMLVKRLDKILCSKGFEINIVASGFEKDPFVII